MTFRLEHSKQCATCPWKASTTVDNIPEYNESMHSELSGTIANSSSMLSSTTNMACHYDNGDNRYCIGWLSNQLGPGNNIPLRIRFLDCENADEIELDGHQVDSFNDTFK